ncbi:MAG: recombinase family protein [Dehalococcoidia bacterium]
MNAQGYRTKRGNPFSEGSIAMVLHNPFYSGKFRYHMGREDEELRDGVHPVPEEVRRLWEKCREVSREKRLEGTPSPPSRQHKVYPLTGVLVCDGCGRPYHGVTLTSRKATRTPRMFHSWHYCGMTPKSVKASLAEDVFATKVLSYVQMDDGWRNAVLKALAREGPEPDHTIEIKRIEAAMANLRKQHLWGVITDEEFKGEYQSLGWQRKALSTPKASAITPNLDRAAALLRDLPALWQHPGVTQEQRRDLAREVFEELRLREGHLVAVKPRPQYAPLFAYSLWRQRVLGGDSSF